MVWRDWPWQDTPLPLSPPSWYYLVMGFGAKPALPSWLCDFRWVPLPLCALTALSSVEWGVHVTLFQG